MFTELMASGSGGGKKVAYGVTTNVVGNVCTVNDLDFQPTYIMIFFRHYAVGYMMEDYDGTTIRVSYYNQNVNHWLENDNGQSCVLTNNGFVFTRATDTNPSQSFQDGHVYYVAIQE